MENLRERIRKIIKEMSATGGGGASFSPGMGAQHASRKSFKKTKNMYHKMGWKKVPKKIKGSGLEVKKIFK